MRGFLKQFAPDLFRPDEISILEDALDDAWRRVEQSKAPTRKLHRVVGLDRLRLNLCAP